MGNSFQSKYYHSDIAIGDNVFMWGGGTADVPLIHDSAEKRWFTSTVDVYNVLTSTIVKKQTTGTPPNGIMAYSCCSIGDDIYYFGGKCKPDTNDCYHNNLFALNTQMQIYQWREIFCDNGPMKKAGCGMIPLHSDDGKDYLLVIGGYGPTPANIPTHSQYVPLPHKPSFAYTNEVHIMCISTAPGKWIVPNKSGSVFPPTAFFSINVLPPGDRAIVFGGACMKDGEIMSHNDVLSISYINNTVVFQVLVNPTDPSVHWPIGSRCFHSSVIINSVSNIGLKKYYLLVLGGADLEINLKPELGCWIMDIEQKKWEQVSIPEVVSSRRCHSMTCFMMSLNCVWLLITGGATNDYTLVTNPNKAMIVEIVFTPTTNQWTVANVMNEKDIHNTANYKSLVFDRLSAGRREMVQLQVQHEEQLSSLQENFQHQLQTIQRKEEVIQERNEIIQQKDEIIQQKQAEIADLRDSLWVLGREEVQLTDEEIGGGAYGSVKVAVFRGTRVAAKCLNDKIVSDYNRGVFTREMEICSRIHHPNIVQFIGATRVNNPILLYELMATSLYKKLQEGQPITRPQIINISCDVSSALAYLHQWRPEAIIHRDVSSPNVLLEPLPANLWRGKLSDFGSANLQLHVKTAIPGNPAYAALEAMTPMHHSPAMDVYSLGILMMEMILHKPPEMDSSQRERRARGITWVAMRVILLNCINNDRSQRLTSLQLLKELQKV